MRRSLLATLLLAQGVPLLRGGDELSHTQGGNNNAYCHDDATTWLDWRLDARAAGFLDFARRLAAVRASQPALRRGQFLRGRLGERPDRTADGALDLAARDVFWLEPDGSLLQDADWSRAESRALAALFPGRAAEEPAATLLLLVNAAEAPQLFTLPRLSEPGGWRVLVDTAADVAAAPLGLRELAPEAASLALGAHALVLLVRTPPRR